MNTRSLALGLLVLLPWSLRAQFADSSVTGNDPSETAVASEASAGANRFQGAVGPHHRRLGGADAVSRGGTQGQRAMAAAQGEGGGVVEIATGLNHWTGSNWAPSDPTFEITDDAFVAERVQHKIRLNAEINAIGSVRVVTPDGQILRSTPVGIGLYDTVSGRSAIIAEVVDCVGTLVSSNRVVYENCFRGISANLVFTLQQGSFEQDLVITGFFDAAAFGFPNDSTRIRVMTEFYQNPSPERMRRPLYVEKDKKVRDQKVSPDLIDEVLSFGEFTLETGSAWTAGTDGKPEGTSATVAKEFVTVSGRTFLIESVEYSGLAEGLKALPVVEVEAMPDQARRATFERSKTGYAVLPNPRPTLASRPDSKPARMTLAQANVSKTKGVVIDYQAIVGNLAANYVFRQGEVYFVSGPTYCSGITALEGGAIFKYPNSQGGSSLVTAYLQISGSLVCKTTPNRPALFTAGDDDSPEAGVPLTSGPSGQWPNHTGDTTGKFYANPAILLPYGLAVGGQTLSHLRFRYCQEAMRVNYYPGSSTPITLAHAELLKCIRGVVINGCTGGCGSGCAAPLTVRNALFDQVQYPVTAYSGQYVISTPFAHCTFDNATRLVTAGSIASTHSFTNSVFANIPTRYSGSASLYGNNNGFYNSFSGQTIGTPSRTAGSNPFFAGTHYLDPAYPDPATSFIDSGSQTAAAAGLYHYTTDPNNVKEQATTVDLGYHYVANGSASGFPGDTVWVEDALPASGVAGAGETWTWLDRFFDTSQTRVPYWGRKCHTGSARHSFTVSSADQRAITPGNTLFAYVYLDPASVPTELRLEWHESGGTWSHQAYWGTASGTDGDANRYLGPLPAAGGWVRLEVAARYVGLDVVGASKTIDGMAFNNTGRIVRWDRAGIAASCAVDSDNDGRADAMEDTNGNGRVDAGESDWRVRGTALLNVNFGSGTKNGPAAVGYSTVDQWNLYNSVNGTPLYLKSSDGTLSDVAVSVAGLNASGTPANLRTGTMTHSDTMYATYQATHGTSQAVKMEVTIRNLPPGTYCLYLYGHGPADADKSTFKVQTVDLAGEETGNYEFQGVNPPDTVPAANSTTSTDGQWETLPFAANRHYLTYTVMVRTNETVKVTVTPGAGSSAAFLNGLQIGRLTRGLYVASEETLVLSEQRTLDLLDYIRNNQFGYLAISNFRNRQSSTLASFIQSVRASCGVLQVAAVDSRASRVSTYNGNNPTARLDAINFETTYGDTWGARKVIAGACAPRQGSDEIEYWWLWPLSEHTIHRDALGNDLATCPATSATRHHAFDPAVTDSIMDRLNGIRTYADEQNLLVEVYIGYPLDQEPSGAADNEYQAILAKTDRLLVHAYTTTPARAYSALNNAHPHDLPSPLSTEPMHAKRRMVRLVTAEASQVELKLKPTILWPILSAEHTEIAPVGGEDHMGQYFIQSRPEDAEGFMKGRYSAQQSDANASWEDQQAGRLTLDGFMYWKSLYMLRP